MTWLSTGLGEHHLLDDFDCGTDSLNRWLAEGARRANRQDTARVYVWTQRGDDRVLAYFAINPTQINREDDGISKSAAVLDRVPAFMISKLAVDRSIQGQGNGKDLVFDAVGRIVGVAQLGGGRLIVVDAIDDAAHAFYRKLDFIPAQNNSHRLYMKVATAHRILGIGQSCHD
jgi:GNAT superfamily N-acetyltransferase